MTEFELPKPIQDQALMINALHFMGKKAEHNAELMAQAMNKMVEGDIPPTEIVFDFFSKFAHDFMTFTMLCDMTVEEFMGDARQFSRDNDGHKEEIQAQLKEHPFMKKMMRVATEDNSGRAERLLGEAIGEGMPDDLVEAIRAAMKGE